MINCVITMQDNPVPFSMVIVSFGLGTNGSLQS
jgi:hypothetical protein